MRGLYIHMPFCKQICSYCDFPKMVSSIENYRIYLDAIKKEINSKRNDLEGITSIYIGGGTPNVYPDNLLEELLDYIYPYLKNSKENTIECNPELITDSQAKLFYKYGINRVSLGVQSISPSALSLLGRHHKMEDVTQAINILRANHIQNISMDFIFGFPNEDIDTLLADLDYVYSMNVPHVSFYSLILEDKTIFSYLLSKGKLKLLDDDIIADMYDIINKRMKEHGYKHYEVSNYAKEGFESIHNELYWKEEEYVGIGMGASGFIKPYRYSNYKSLKKYLELVEEEKIEIDSSEEKKEFMMLGLRMLDGISLSYYEMKYHSSPILDFDLSKHIDSGILKIEDDRLFIPEDKLFIANIVYEEFV
ncbi:oxygen-independent coproporphyrinogen-3 oxidase [Anaeroplasma bactoclasticum]|uniref:Heme chaperone HemW n=1 Tax=Anaeroplasma bactoclasticum TaxID=2088 RepID=A0A397S187_9MOLU|nr:radical SAM family heme chaperone HemW [Anaeroplasma bactoclasticum]RIA75974.1 oxygen-independent coproporphyrinogen-3 oxidase [Anaeroplasma bactoclasticum]